MSFDFLVPISTYPDPTPTDGLRRALDLAATMTGRVTALVQEVDIPPLHNILAEVVLDVSAMAARAEAASKARGSLLAGEVQHLASYLRLPMDVQTLRCLKEDTADRMARVARTYDYTMLVPDPQCSEQRDIVEAVLFGSGGPVIVFPAEEAPAHLATVVIAWDGSRAAARAVHDALPVLTLAHDVCVATFEDDKLEAAATLPQLRRLLTNHGIDTRHVGGVAGNTAIGDAIQDLALVQEAGLLVMGAYGHSRMREFVLGGATSAVLGGARLPVLMSH
jgi:nucleotide-binding universal stress UspA family protein